MDFQTRWIHKWPTYLNIKFWVAIPIIIRAILQIKDLNCFWAHRGVSKKHISNYGSCALNPWFFWSGWEGFLAHSSDSPHLSVEWFIFSSPFLWTAFVYLLCPVQWLQLFNLYLQKRNNARHINVAVCINWALCACIVCSFIKFEL